MKDPTREMIEEIMDPLFFLKIREMLLQDLALPSEGFDSVISSFAVCHGRSESDYRNLYAKIQDCLKPQGCFLCLDLVCGAEVDLTMIGFQDWEKLLESHFSETDIQKIIRNVIVEDYPLSIPQHLALLSEVGFKAPDVLWKENVFALYGGFEKQTAL